MFSNDNYEPFKAQKKPKKFKQVVKQPKKRGQHDRNKKVNLP